MNIDVLDQTGKKIEAIALNARIFGANVNASLVAQAIRVRLINARTGTAHTKTRDEVRGGGRKPWRQKGTGRARHGSIRSPLWRSGGITHGPRFHKPSVSMPTSMRRAALFSALTDKLQNNGVVVIDKFEVKNYKTKELAAILSALPVDRSVLIVTAKKDEKLQRAVSNLPQVKVMTANVLHPYEILKYRTVVFMQDSLPVLENTFVKGEGERAKGKVEKKSEVKEGKEVKAAAKKSPDKKAVAKSPKDEKPGQATAKKKAE